MRAWVAGIVAAVVAADCGRAGENDVAAKADAPRPTFMVVSGMDVWQNGGFGGRLMGSTKRA